MEGMEGMEGTEGEGPGACTRGMGGALVVWGASPVDECTGVIEVTVAVMCEMQAWPVQEGTPLCCRCPLEGSRKGAEAGSEVGDSTDDEFGSNAKDSSTAAASNSGPEAPSAGRGRVAGGGRAVEGRGGGGACCGGGGASLDAGLWSEDAAVRANGAHGAMVLAVVLTSAPELGLAPGCPPAAPLTVSMAALLERLLAFDVDLGRERVEGTVAARIPFVS